MAKSLPIVGIDPGLSSGGLVAIDAADEDHVLFSRSLVTKGSERKLRRARARELYESLGEPGWGDLAYMEADIQAGFWVLAAVAALEEFIALFGRPAYLAIESFVDQHSKAKRLMKDRWKAPHAIGLLSGALLPLGFSVEGGNLVYQDAGVVLTQFQAELAILDARRRPFPDGVVVPGDSLVGNEHESRALVHALALSNHVSYHSARTRLAASPILPTP